VECPNGTWVKEIRVKSGAAAGIELDCFAPGADTKTRTVFAGTGVAMMRNSRTHCDNQVMRGITLTGNDAQGTCEYDDKQAPYGSLCDDSNTAVCGIKMEKRGISTQ